LKIRREIGPRHVARCREILATLDGDDRETIEVQLISVPRDGPAAP
jgi:hypothetical protein